MWLVRHKRRLSSLAEPGVALSLISPQDTTRTARCQALPIAAEFAVQQGLSSNYELERISRLWPGYLVNPSNGFM
jgi:hypothetical protein